MRTLAEQLAHYAAYHRDRRNVAMHFVGIPLIVVAIAILLARPPFDVLGLTLTPVVPIATVIAVYYVALDLRFGLLMAVLIAMAVWGGHFVAQMPTPVWLAVGVAMFVVGWIFQFLGHYWEGRRPAFVDDLAGLATGPLFVVAEAAFALGLRKSLRAEVSRQAGVEIRSADVANADTTAGPHR
jgi:uncharacterized membrane protein YGL010W